MYISAQHHWQQAGDMLIENLTLKKTFIEKQTG
jgi:hypothetical protein